MALIDAYYKFNVGWDEEVTLPTIKVVLSKSNGCMIDKFFRSYHISAFHEIPWCCLDGNADYSFEYFDGDHSISLLRLNLFVLTDPNHGFILSSIKTDDCMICKTDREGCFEFFVFKGLKYKQGDLLGMLIRGDLDREIKEFLKSS
jgi:hypothetical protein